LEQIYSNLSVVEEKIVLRKKTLDDGKILFVIDSDLEGAAKGNETFKKKDEIKASGLFVFDGKNLRKWVSKKSYTPEEFESVSQEFRSLVSKINKETSETVSGDDIQDYAEAGMQDKIAAFLNDLKEKIKADQDSPEVKNFLEFRSKFRKYSFNNQMLIFLQNPKSTRIAGKSKWYNEFNRKLKEGAKGIYIYVPIKGKRDEPDTTKTNVDETKNQTFFILRPVYDISDTEVIEGKQDKVVEEPKWFDDEKVDEKTRVIYDALSALAKNEKIRVEITGEDGDELDGARGSSSIGKIKLLIENISTFIHEIAHELLHGIHERLNSPWLRQIRELEAEGVAYVVLREFNLPSEHASKYLAIWKIDPENVKEHEQDIKIVSSFIIDYINVFATAGEDEANQFASAYDRKWEVRKKDWEASTVGIKEQKLTFKEYLLEKKKRKKKSKSKKRSPFMFPYGVGFYHSFPSETNAGDGSGVN
jgi:hypothetical protein